MKILAIKLRAIGDTVIWTSALNALKAEYPDAEIHVMTYATNAAVLVNQPAIHRTHLLTSTKRKDMARMLWSLRSEKFDWLLGFHATTALARWAWIAGAERKVLHHHSWTYTPRGSAKLAEPGKLEDAISRDYQVLRAMGLNPKRLPTSLPLFGKESVLAEQQMEAAILKTGINMSLPRLAILPGASQHLRRYPKDLLLQLIADVKAKRKYQPVVIVDRALSTEWNLQEECERLDVPLLHGGSLREFICLISRTQRAVANDSGPGHIAVALGIDTSFIFGPGCVGDWHPYDAQKNPVYRVQVPCRAQGPRDQEAFQFCTLETCDHHSCMRQISVSSIGQGLDA